MKISELEKILQIARETHGDLEVINAGHPGEIGTVVTEHDVYVIELDPLRSKKLDLQVVLMISV